MDMEIDTTYNLDPNLPFYSPPSANFSPSSLTPKRKTSIFSKPKGLGTLPRKGSTSATKSAKVHLSTTDYSMTLPVTPKSKTFAVSSFSASLDMEESEFGVAKEVGILNVSQHLWNWRATNVFKTSSNITLSTTPTGNNALGHAFFRSTGVSKVPPPAFSNNVPVSPSRRTSKLLLPPQHSSDNGLMTVVLDLDETLIHSEFTGIGLEGSSLEQIMRQKEERKHVTGQRPPDFSFVLHEGEPDEEVIHVYKRPGLEKFLEELSKVAEVIIFTASLPIYARPILSTIDPNNHCRHHLFRSSTIQYNNYPHVKSLKRLGRDLKRTILVDNSPFAMMADPSNAVPIEAYYDNSDDVELDRLIKLVKTLDSMEDVRPYLRKKFKFTATLASIGA